MVSVSSSPFLVLEEAAAYLRCSPRSLQELTRTNAIPLRKAPGARRILFRPDELDAWMDGAALEVEELDRGGRIVRPIAGSRETA